MPHFPFQRLQEDIAALIASTPPGQRLLNEPELSKKLGVSRATLREAMRTFETQGLIRRKQGSGTFVVGKLKALDSGLEVLESLDTMAKRQGVAISVSDLEVLHAEADLIQAVKLGVSEGSELTIVRRVIRTDSRPVAYLVDALPAEFFSSQDLPHDFHGSVLDFLLERGDLLTTSSAEVTAKDAEAEVAKALEIQRGDVLLHFAAQLYNAENRIVDYSLSYFVPGHFHFHIVRKVGGG